MKTTVRRVFRREPSNEWLNSQSLLLVLQESSRVHRNFPTLQKRKTYRLARTEQNVFYLVDYFS